MFRRTLKDTTAVLFTLMASISLVNSQGKLPSGPSLLSRLFSSVVWKDATAAGYFKHQDKYTGPEMYCRLRFSLAFDCGRNNEFITFDCHCQYQSEHAAREALKLALGLNPVLEAPQLINLRWPDGEVRFLQLSPALAELREQGGILFSVAVWVKPSMSNDYIVQGRFGGLVTQFPECNTYPLPPAVSCDTSGGAMRFWHTDSDGTSFSGVVFFCSMSDHEWTHNQLRNYYSQYVKMAIRQCTVDGPVPVDATSLALCFYDSIQLLEGSLPRSILATLQPRLADHEWETMQVAISFDSGSVLLPYHSASLGPDGALRRLGLPQRFIIPSRHGEPRSFVLLVAVLLPINP